MTADDDNRDALKLGSFLKNGATEETETAWLIAQEQKLLSQVREQHQQPHDLGQARKLTKRWGQAFGAAAMAAGLLAGFIYLRAPDSAAPVAQALTFTLDGQAAQASGKLMADEKGQLVTFSDGSALNLSQGARAQVKKTHPDGATLVLERGSMESVIVHQKRTRWSVLLGPYEVKVTGTRFTSHWDPVSEKASVLLHEGSVQILGEGIDDVVQLNAGQRFVGNAEGEGKWRLSEVGETQENEARAEEPQESPSSSAVEQSEANADDEQQAHVTAPVTRGEAHQTSWSSLIAKGRSKEVLTAATARGIDACLSGCSTADLRALGDAARYNGDPALARRALTRLRARSPSEKARAGYLLGSLAEAQGQIATALTWYSRYAAESGSGALLSEAQAGRIRCLSKLGRTSEAKKAAASYLRRYPNGVGENVARQVLNKP